MSSPDCSPLAAAFRLLRLNPSACCDPVNGIFCESINGVNRIVRLGWASKGLVGPIPDRLAELSELTSLVVDKNELTGEIPEFFGTAFPKLQNLWLGQNQLTGSIPEFIGNLRRLQILDVTRNRMSGPLPSALSTLTELTWLDLSGNSFTGDLPNLENLRNMGHINLFSLVLIPQIFLCIWFRCENWNLRKDSIVFYGSHFERINLQYLHSIITNTFMTGALPFFLYNVQTLQVFNSCLESFDSAQVADKNLNIVQQSDLICAPYRAASSVPSPQPPAITSDPLSTSTGERTISTAPPSTGSSPTSATSLTSATIPLSGDNSVVSVMTSTRADGVVIIQTVTSVVQVNGGGANASSSNAWIPGLVGGLLGLLAVVLGVVAIMALRRRRAAGDRRGEKERETLEAAASNAGDGQATVALSNVHVMPAPGTQSVTITKQSPYSSTTHTSTSAYLFSGIDAPSTPTGTMMTSKEMEVGMFPGDAGKAISSIKGAKEKDISVFPSGRPMTIGGSGGSLGSGLGDVVRWNRDHVRRWLEELDVGERLVRILWDANVTGSRLLLITDDQLTQMGVSQPLSRQIILAAVEQLRTGGVGGRLVGGSVGGDVAPPEYS
ncbi:hypothetical protein HDU67_006385 [Dinochytrium kinnereticum]|nr:hypothetical protein HDU67_006385 [Dinochytrium kinnereticum]